MNAAKGTGAQNAAPCCGCLLHELISCRDEPIRVVATRDALIKAGAGFWLGCVL